MLEPGIVSGEGEPRRKAICGVSFEVSEEALKGRKRKKGGNAQTLKSANKQRTKLPSHGRQHSRAPYAFPEER